MSNSNTDDAILKMLREVRDLRVCKPDMWAATFGRETSEIEQLLKIVSDERLALAA